MFVVKRDGRREDVKFDKITSRINKLCYGLDQRYVDSAKISQKVIQGVYPGVTTVELDELAAQTSAYMATQHPDFSKLAARISVSNLHKQTNKVTTRAGVLYCSPQQYHFLSTDHNSEPPSRFFYVPRSRLV